MRKTMLKWMSLLLAVLLMLGGSACKKPDTGKEAETMLPVGGQIRLVYPARANADTQRLAERLAKQLQEHTIHSVTVFDDILKKGEQADPNALEIYLGQVDRDESRAFLEQLPPCGYGWAVNGSKLLISAVSEAELADAVSLFLENGLGQIGNTETPFANVKRTVYEPEYLTLVENGAPVATLSANFSDSESYEVAQALQDYIKIVTGVEMTLLNGNGGDIVIVSDSTINSIDYNSFGVRFYNGRIKLEGESSTARLKCLDYLKSLLKQYYAAGENRLCIPKDQLICWTANHAFPSLPVYGGVPSVYEYKGNRMVYLENSSPDEFDAYIEQLRGEGYDRRSTVSKNGNRYDTLTDGQFVLYASYTAYNSSVRLISASIKQYENMQALGSVSQAEGDVSFSAMNFGNVKDEDGKLFASGMSYAFQLSDGSFILIDGGYPTASSEVDRLYNWLVEQTPQGQPVRIAAWLITHLHWDHIGIFCNFMTKYHDQVEVESVFTNYPTYAYLLSFSSYRGEKGDGKGYLGETINPDVSPGWHDKNYGDFENALKVYFDEDEIIVPHTGQTVKIGNVQIEILYTHEDFYPRAMYVTNNMSVVYRITAGNTSFVFGGDVQEEAQDVCTEINGSTLKSDYIQAPHHGGNGSLGFFRAVDPQFALLPHGGLKASTGWNGYTLRLAANRWLATNVKKTIYAGDGITTIELKVD